MSVSRFEREVADAARQVLCCPKLRIKDLVEWRLSPIEEHVGEVVIELRVDGIAVWVAVSRQHDRRDPLGPGRAS